jgi:hypothetical protein
VVYDYVLGAALRPDGGSIFGAKSTGAYVASVGEPFLCVTHHDHENGVPHK